LTLRSTYTLGEAISDHKAVGNYGAGPDWDLASVVHSVGGEKVLSTRPFSVRSVASPLKES